MDIVQGQAQGEHEVGPAAFRLALDSLKIISGQRKVPEIKKIIKNVHFMYLFVWGDAWAYTVVLVRRPGDALSISLHRGDYGV